MNAPAKSRAWAPKPTAETIESANKLFDMAISQHNLKTDAGLSRHLDIEACVISRIRNGHCRLSAETILRLYEKCGIPMDTLFQARDGQL